MKLGDKAVKAKTSKRNSRLSQHAKQEKNCENQLVCELDSCERQKLRCQAHKKEKGFQEIIFTNVKRQEAFHSYI